MMRTIESTICKVLKIIMHEMMVFDKGRLLRNL